MNAFAWCLVHAIEVHAIVALVLSGPSRSAVIAIPDSTVSQVDIVFEEDRPLVSPGPQREKVETRSSRPSPVVGRPGKASPAHRGAPASAAASAVALPDVGEPLPVATAPVYRGGLTSATGTSDEPVDEVGSGGNGLQDLSAPAHLDGRRNWACNVQGAPDQTVVRARVLVRPDGSAVRAEILDRGDIPDLVLNGAAPCVMAERYVPGRDHDGRPAQRWTRPFRIVVVGIAGD